MDTTQEHVTDVLNNTKDHLFITGGAGVGKSYVVKGWLSTVDRAKVAICAPTGIAALNVGGVTLHRMFHIPFSIAELEYQATISVSKMKREKKFYLRTIETLLIDEISMVRSDILDYVETSLRLVRDSDEPWGGVRIVAVGDPFQLPPVVGRQDKHKILEPWFFSSKAWNKETIPTYNLTKIYRQAGDPTFANILNNLRRGKVVKEDLQNLNKRYTRTPDPEALILATTNVIVDNKNQEELDKIDDEELYFKMEVHNYTEDYYIEKSIPAVDHLYLKRGARVMMLVNNNDGKGTWVNGSLGTIVDFQLTAKNPEHHFITIELDNGKVVRPTRHKWVAEECSMDGDDLQTDILGEATQFPVRLGYAITVHKSQGMTFENLHCVLDRVFERGQAYVALSRATCLSGLTLANSVRLQHIMTDMQVKRFMRDT